jgi:hypothetical protein
MLFLSLGQILNSILIPAAVGKKNKSTWRWRGLLTDDNHRVDA